MSNFTKRLSEGGFLQPICAVSWSSRTTSSSDLHLTPLSGTDRRALLGRYSVSIIRRSRLKLLRAVTSIAANQQSSTLISATGLGADARGLARLSPGLPKLSRTRRWGALWRNSRGCFRRTELAKTTIKSHLVLVRPWCTPLSSPCRREIDQQLSKGSKP